jgi:hypothetical protein
MGEAFKDFSAYGRARRVTVHLTPKQLWLIDSGRVFTGFPGCFGLPSNGICDSLRA